jgi:YD repeat-containing protein
MALSRAISALAVLSMLAPNFGALAGAPREQVEEHLDAEAATRNGKPEAESSAEAGSGTSIGVDTALAAGGAQSGRSAAPAQPELGSGSRAVGELGSGPSLQVTPTPTPDGGVPPTLEPPSPYPSAGEVEGVMLSLSVLSSSSSEPPPAPGWSLPQSLASTADLSDWPAVTSHQSGTLQAVWTEGASGSREVYYAEFSDGAWSLPVNVSLSPAVDSNSPDIAVDDSGVAHIVWQDGLVGDADIEVRYSECSGGSCTAPLDLSNGRCGPYAGEWHAWTPSIVYGPDGQLMATWASFEPGTNRFPSMTWTPPAGPPPGIGACMPYTGAIYMPDLVAGAGSERRVVFENFQTATVYHGKYTSGSGGSALSVASGSTPRLALDEGGTSHVLWCIAGSVRYRSGDGSGSWTSIEDVAVGPQCGGPPAVAIRPDGLVQAVWEDWSFGVQILQSIRNVTGWTAPASVSRSPGSGEDPALTADPDGNLYLLWADSRPGNFDIHYSSLSLGVLVDEGAVLTSAGKACVDQTQAKAQGYTAAPINTRTGGYDYSVEDLSVPTSAGPLVLLRSYASLAIGTEGQPLGFGWTHNHLSRLIFPSDPGGEAGFVLFQADTANRVRFVDNEDGTFSAAPGARHIDPRGGPPVTYSVTDEGQRSYAFDEQGKLLAWQDAQGHSWTYSYNLDGRLSAVQDESGARSLEFDYDLDGHLQLVDDHTGRSVSFSYDASGDLVSAIDVLGQTWTYLYDVGHRLTEVIDPRGFTVERTEYDPQGRAVRQFDGLGNLVVEIIYNPDGTSTIVDSRGNAETHQYDNRQTLAGSTDALGGSSGRVYDGNFRPAAITDEDGSTTYLTWSLDGNPSRSSTPRAARPAGVRRPQQPDRGHRPAGRSPATPTTALLTQHRRAGQRQHLHPHARRVPGFRNRPTRQHHQLHLRRVRPAYLHDRRVVEHLDL